MGGRETERQRNGETERATDRQRDRVYSHFKSFRYALQFSAISLFYLFSWVFFRIFPKYITSEDSLNWFAVISICVAINCSANALVYLFTNVEASFPFSVFLKQNSGSKCREEQVLGGRKHQHDQSSISSFKYWNRKEDN